MDVIILLILIIQLLLIGQLIYICIKKQSTTIHTIIYFMAIFILNFIINYIAVYHEENSKVSLFETLVCILNSFKTFVFDADIEEYNVAFSRHYILYPFVYGLGAFMGASMTIFTIINAFKLTLINKFRLFKCRRNNCDIVMGNLDSCKKYCSSYKNTIIWVTNMDNEEVKSLIDDGYTIINKELSVINLSKFAKNKKQYNVIYFEDEHVNFENITIFEKYINENYLINYHFYIEIPEKDSLFINNLVLSEKSKRYITTFSINELLIRKFVEESPLTLKLPSDFINADTTFNNNKKINVFIVGFNKFHQELLKQLILNNQFVTVKDNEYVNSLINYYIYDEKQKLDSCSLLKSIDRKYSKLINNKNEYFELPDKIANINYKEIGTNAYDIVDDILKISEDKNSFNYVFILENESQDSLDLLSMLNEEIKNKNIYYYLKIASGANTLLNSNISIYGKKEDIVNHDVIVDEKLNKLAIAINANYNLKSKDENYAKWLNINKFTKISNIFASLNLRFKLNLLGLDYKLGRDSNNYINEVTGGIPNEFKFDYYDNKNIITALIAQEHARWNAFHIVNGFVPMKKCDIKMDNNLKFTTKNLDEKEHVCITTYKGLKYIAKYQLEMAKKIDPNVEIERFDVYKYDLSLLIQANKTLCELGYQIIKK